MSHEEESRIIAAMNARFDTLTTKVESIDKRTERLSSIMYGDEVDNKKGLGERVRNLEDKVAALFKGIAVLAAATATALIKGFWSILTGGNNP